MENYESQRAKELNKLHPNLGKLYDIRIDAALETLAKREHEKLSENKNARKWSFANLTDDELIQYVTETYPDTHTLSDLRKKDPGLYTRLNYKNLLDKFFKPKEE